MILPVKENNGEISGVKKLAGERILQEIKKFDSNAIVEIPSEGSAIVKVDNDIIARLIGKNGSNISDIEKKLGIHIDVEPRIPSLGKDIVFDFNESGNSLGFNFERSFIGKIISIYVEDKFLFSATVGKNGSIKISKNSDIGRELLKGIIGKKKIKALL